MVDEGLEGGERGERGKDGDRVELCSSSSLRHLSRGLTMGFFLVSFAFTFQISMSLFNVTSKYPPGDQLRATLYAHNRANTFVNSEKSILTGS